MRTSTKITAVIGGAALTVATAGVAYAYWSSTGTGTGTAGTGTNSAFVVTSDADTALANVLTPGGPTQTVAFHVQNTNSGVQYASSAVVSVAASTGAAWTSGTCNADDFTVGTPVFTAGQIASGATKDGSVTISMKNNNENQDDCRGLSVPLYISVS